MTYIISEDSCDVGIIIFFLSAHGILSKIRLNLRIACWKIIWMLVYGQMPEKSLNATKIKPQNLFLDQDVDAGVYCQMTDRIQKILCDFGCSCKWKAKPIL